MQTLDIECPSCGELLELDAGFAGGVCRCSNCGTLMTVPGDKGKAESLSRPTSSASVGSGGMSSMGVPDTGRRRSASGGGKASGGKGKKSKASGRRRVNTTIEPGEYRTASGKVVRLDETTRVPMAEGKRKKIRVATTAVFFAVIAGVVGLAVVGIIAMMGGPGGIGGQTVAKYDPAANPYTLDFANVAGLPVSGGVAVVVEASEYSGAWMPQAADVIAAGLGKAGEGAEVALMGAGAAEPVPFADGGLRGVPIDSGELGAWFEELPETGEADFESAIKAALKLKPGTLILVLGYADVADVQAWDKLLAGREGLTVHTVLIGDSSSELQGWMSDRGGEMVILSPSDIEALKGMAQEDAGDE